jgi:NAD(P)-dependent dehydrogenase (short-subunit alcohol dehydrogenase family)
MSLRDKSAVVTGGSRGLGLGLVEALVAHGARVTVVARNTEVLDSVRARLGVPRSPPMLRTRPQPTGSLRSSAQTSWH